MKTKIFTGILLIISIILAAISAFISYDNDRLRSSISRQDSIINRSLKDDKFDKKIENYTDSIKTITNKISILINDKEVSGSQIVAIIDRLQAKNDSLDNRLWETSQLLKYAKDNYNFDVYLKRNGSSGTLNRNESQADSAKVLLRHFRKRLSKDKNGNWIVDVSGGDEDKKKIREMIKSMDSLTKQK